MQIVYNRDNLHEMSDPVFWEKNKKKINITNLSSAEFAQRMVTIKLGYDSMKIDFGSA